MVSEHNRTPGGRAYATPDLAGSEQQGLVVGDDPLIENMSVGTDRGTAAPKDRRAPCRGAGSRQDS
jgi:hypothetical protein